jgi:hypothetical protein
MLALATDGGGVVVTLLGFRLWPRLFVVLLGVCELLVAAAVFNNLVWLLLLLALGR